MEWIWMLAGAGVLALCQFALVIAVAFRENQRRDRIGALLVELRFDEMSPFDQMHAHKIWPEETARAERLAQARRKG